MEAFGKAPMETRVHGHGSEQGTPCEHDGGGKGQSQHLQVPFTSRTKWNTSSQKTL